MDKHLEEKLKREEFAKKFNALLTLNDDLDDIKLQAELQNLIQTSNIDTSYTFPEDTFYENIVELLKDFCMEKKSENAAENAAENKSEKFSQKRYNPKHKKYNKHKKVYKDEYEAERDFKLNIYKKNLFATPYFQEKKRRNAFNFNKSKPKDKSNWKKKGKMHQK